jgi:microcystin-dependent protein
MAVGQGSGPGLSPTSMGEKAGATNVTIQSMNMPAHSHTLNAMQVKLKASSANADESAADGNFPAIASSSIYSGNGATANTFTGGVQVSGTTDISGSNMPLEIMNPYLVMNYSIAIYGIFPSRN